MKLLLVMGMVAFCAIPLEVSAKDSNPKDVGQSNGRADLKENMKAMGKHFKVLKSDAADPKKNANTLVAAKALLKLYEETLNQIEEGVKIIAERDKETEKVAYEKLTKVGIEETKALIKALQENNNVLAKQIVDKMKATERKGHDKYQDPNSP